MSQANSHVTQTLIGTHASGVGMQYVFSFKSKKTGKFVVPKGVSSILLNRLRRHMGWLYSSSKRMDTLSLNFGNQQELTGIKTVFRNMLSFRETNEVAIREQFPIKNRLVYGFGGFYGYNSGATEIHEEYITKIERFKNELYELESSPDFSYKINVMAVTNKAYYTKVGQPEHLVFSNVTTSNYWGLINSYAELGFIPIYGNIAFHGKEVFKMITL
jgi:hypothetical protein